MQKCPLRQARWLVKWAKRKFPEMPWNPTGITDEEYVARAQETINGNGGSQWVIWWPQYRADVATKRGANA